MPATPHLLSNFLIKSALALLVLLVLATLPNCPNPLDGNDPSPSPASSEAPSPTPTATATATASANSWALLSLNLHCLKLDGTSYASNPERFAAVAAAVAAEEVRVLLLQEACDDGQENAMDLLEAAIESATAADWSAQWGWAHTGWEGTPDEAEEGLGILVRGPLSETTESEHRSQGGLRRISLAARLPPDLGSLRVVSVHFEVGDASARAAQGRETATWGLSLADPDYDLLIGGDFNDQVDAPAYSNVKNWGYRDLSDGLDPTRIDHVFAHRGAAITATDRQLIFVGNTWPIVSDHPGVLVRLSPAQGETVVRTTIDIHHDPGPTQHLWIRGDSAPLSWSAGWPAHPQSPGLWSLILTELPAAPFEYKALLNDSTWMQDPDATGTGGQANEVTPVFP